MSDRLCVWQKGLRFRLLEDEAHIIVVRQNSSNKTFEKLQTNIKFLSQNVKELFMAFFK
jgi:hypothetical protein